MNSYPNAQIQNPHPPLPDYGLLLALLLPLFAVMPLLTHAGLPNTADGPAHLMRQVELNRAWQEGNFYPRWGTDLAFGHGMPIFSYAPPALYQLTQFFHLFGLPLDESMKAVLILDFLLYSLGMFLFARRVFGPYPALVAAALYVYAPYRLREAYIQGNYGQFTGLAFYPFICWAFHGLITTGQTRYLVAAAFSLAGLLFSHNISFMIFGPLLAVYLLFLLVLTAGEAQQETKIKPSPISYLFSALPRLWQIAAAGLLGLGLAAIFWLPAFGERHEIQLEGITRGFFDFRENFISPQEFFALPLPLDLSAINPELPLSLGLPQVIGAAAGLIVLLLVGIKVVFRRIPPPVQIDPPIGQPGKTLATKPSTFYLPLASPQSSPVYRLLSTVYFALFFGLYAFLALPQSKPVWEVMPLLELAEFPWRMLGPAIFCASLLGAFGFTICDIVPFGALRFRVFSRQGSIHLSNFLFLIFLFLPIALNLYYLYPSQFIVRGTPGPADAFAYEVTSGAIGTTSTGEFLPRYAQQRPQPDTLWPDYETGRLPQKIDPASLPPGAAVKTIYHRSESDSFFITTSQAFTATIRTLYWPGWQVYLDDRPAPFTVAPNTGLIQTAVPAGQHTLTLQLESTPLRTTGLWLTILTFSLLVVIIGIALKKQFALRPQGKLFQVSPFGTPFGRRASCFTFPSFALTATLLITLYLFSRPLATFFTLQSDPNRPRPAGQILQVDFGQKAAQNPLIRLVGMDELPSAVELADPNGAELTTTLYWRAWPDLDTNYSVFLHLDAPNGQTFATVDEAHPENIPTRNWPPGLYLRNPLHLKIPPNLPPIRYDVTVGLYDPQSGERLAILPGETTAFKLGSIWLTRPQPRLPQTPLAHFGPHITLWQADYPAEDNSSVALYWQAAQPPDRNDAIFVHLLDAKGNLLAQADGLPYAGLYPLTNWQPGQIIVDTRPITSLVPNPADLAAIAIGVYDPATSERLSATNAGGQPLPDNSFILRVKP